MPMKKTAIAAPEPRPPESREEMEDLVRDICAKEIQAAEMKNQMEAMIMAVRDRFEDQITACREDIKGKLELAEMWALANPDEFKGKKSVVMVHGTVGYRTGMPRLKTIRGYTWDRVLDLLRRVAPDYIRIKEEVAKDAIIAQAADIGPDLLKQVGVKVEQNEAFYVEPHKNEVPS